MTGQGKKRRSKNADPPPTSPPVENDSEESSPDQPLLPDEVLDAQLPDIVEESVAPEPSSEVVPTERKALVVYDPLDAYLAEIRRFQPLSREDEHQAALEYQRSASSEAAYKLVATNLWLVVKISREYERIARTVLDLIQEGNIGLMEAVKNFDPYRGVRFPSYAVWWIRAYIIRYIIANWRLVKIGTTQAQRKLFFNLRKESDRLEREGIYPTPKLIADKLNVREGDVIEMSQRLGGSDVSVDAPLQDDSDSTLLSVLSNGEISVEDKVARRQLGKTLSAVIDEFKRSLKPKEITILQGRVLSDEKLTLQELSDDLKLSKERVRQIENKLREKLQNLVTSKLGTELQEWVEPGDAER